MTTPPPAPFTADENEETPAHWLRRWLARLLALWPTIRRALSLAGAALIVLVLVWLTGYAVGRHSVAPRPGEEARLDSANKRLQATADSARKVAEWERAQNVMLTQKLAALPTVTIREPGVLVIGPTDSQLVPRVVPVPVEVTQVLATERAITTSLRVELAARTAEAAAERARADSLSRAVVLARAERRGWADGRVVLTVGYGVTSAGGVVRPGWQVGVGVALWRWP